MKTEIVSVIEINRGIAKAPKSFIITNGSNNPNRTEIVLIAEKLFEETAKANGMSHDELEEALDNGFYANNNGNEVLLTWSEIMN